MNLPDPAGNPPGNPGGQSRGGGISPKAIIGLVAAILVVVFILQNRDRVQIEFLVFSFSCPLWLILLIMAVAGALLDDFVLKGFRKSRGKTT